MRPTVSFLRPVCWRVSWAAWAAKGKPMSSAATGRLSSVRLSRTPLFFSVVRARAGVGSRGGKTRGWGGHGVGDVLKQGGLVILHGQQIVGAVLHDQLPGGLVLSVERVQRHGASTQIQRAKELARHRNFI